MVAETNKVILIDGSGYIFRAYYALPPMLSPDNVPVNAVFGFFKMLLKLRHDYAGDSMIAVFDSARKTFRNDIYPEYKANRGAPPEDLVPQFKLVRDAVDALCLPRIEVAGYEADDVIASLAKKAREQNQEVTIISSDKDLMQLIRDGVGLHDPMKNKPLGAQEVLERFGVTPDRVVEVQAIAGDSVDNIPGAAGIGVKTAALLLNEYGTLDELLRRADEIKQPKRRENLLAFREVADISLQLVRLCDSVPEAQNITFDAMPVLDRNNARAFVEHHGFKSLMKLFAGESSGDSDTATEGENTQAQLLDSSSITTITSINIFHEMLDNIAMQGYVALYPHIASEKHASDKNSNCVGIGFALHDECAYYLPLHHVLLTETQASQGDLLIDNSQPTAETIRTRREDIPNIEATHSLLAKLLQDDAVLKIGYDVKKIWQIFREQEIQTTPCEDVLLLSFTLDAGRKKHGFLALAEEFLPSAVADIISNSQETYSKQDIALYAPNDAKDVIATYAFGVLQLYKILWQRLCTEGMVSLYKTLDMALLPILAKMEWDGVLLDQAHLQQLSDEFAIKIKVLEGNIHKEAGEEFNIGSPKQLGIILFDKMALPFGRKTKTGQYSTDNDLLDNLVLEGHGIASDIQQWRHLSKLRSTYTESLPLMQDADDRVRTNYAMAGAQTGRLSSIDPNLQNIPIRDEEGKKIREAFIAPQDQLLLSLDYSQIELRLIADIARLESLIDAFHKGADIHQFTASEVFNIPLDQVDAGRRRDAKAVNFGIIYGISAFGLARQLMISRKQAQEYINAYLERYQGLKKYMDETVEIASKQGYVQTLFGRKIHLPHINDKNPMKRQYAGRQAINAPIQGTAADIIKQAMLQVDRAITDDKLPARMLLQVHDELLFEVEASAIDVVTEKLINIMQQVRLPDGNQLKVPLIVESGYGKNWAEAH
ncbi:MAG: DNA polymerase I [Alphaproteobacteria bacterium]|nr:DNA polymerase I [Alphaproteobacteria bacterium]